MVCEPRAKRKGFSVCVVRCGCCCDFVTSRCAGVRLFLLGLQFHNALDIFDKISQRNSPNDLDTFFWF